MSLRAITWAFDQHDITPTQRLLLLALADTANHEHETWPSVATLEKKTGFGKSTIYRERTALCDSGKLTRKDRDRYVLHVGGVPERESDSQSGTDIPRAGNALHKGTQKNPDEPLAADAAERATEDKAQALWVAYHQIVKHAEPQTVGEITPSMRRTADKALAEFPFDDLLTALRGFVAWRRKKPGDTRFSSIFATHPGGRPLHDHIDFWISQATDASALDGVKTHDRVQIMRHVRDAQRAHGSHDPETQEVGRQALEWLKQNGIEPVPRDDGYPTFPTMAGARG